MILCLGIEWTTYILLASHQLLESSHCYGMRIQCTGYTPIKTRIFGHNKLTNLITSSLNVYNVKLSMQVLTVLVIAIELPPKLILTTFG